MVLPWEIWMLSTITIQTKLIKLEIFQMSVTSSKILFGTKFKAHSTIVENRAARHLRLKKFGNNKNLKKKKKKREEVQG
jgi:hypothetical protein